MAEGLAAVQLADAAATQQPAAEETQAAAAGTSADNPEEEKKSIYKGMRNIENKNTVVNLESKKATWQTLDVPQPIIDGLGKLAYYKPSIIQAQSIPHVMKKNNNFAFQAMNGSGKTGAFVIPALMKVDPNVLKI